MLKNGPAIEVKKAERKADRIQLNSSHPLSRLVSEDKMITSACRNSEDGSWTEKDMI